MSEREVALREYLRSGKAWCLMEAITTSADPVWAEDEIIYDLLANIDRATSSQESGS